MNLASRDIRYHLGRFVLTGLGVGLLLATVMAMGGIYRGMVEDALSIIRGFGADLWVVQKDTNGPFAEVSRVPEDLSRAIRSMAGVREASPVAFQSVQLREGGRALRVQLIGARPGALGTPRAVVDGRPLASARYEMVVDRRAGIAPGSRVAIGRLRFSVVGLSDGMVGSGGDPVVFVSLQDAQEIQFLKGSEAIRNDRARIEADLSVRGTGGIDAASVAPLVQNTHLANAVLVGLEPWADPGDVTARIERWNHYRAMTASEQEDVLARSVIERARQQILLFRITLLAVSTVIIALIIYTMTMEKTRDIATLKVIGASDRTIAALILQESLGLGLLGFVLGWGLISGSYEYFPRRVAILPLDQYVLLGIVLVICVLASLLGIRRALSVDPTTALAGGA
ncbi:MAG: ABC transporter permease [candidate division NC10 bacterium]